MMPLRKSVLVVLSLAVAPIAMAQTGFTESSDAEKSFADFRKSILSGYDDFRHDVLDNYAKFLDGIWEEYEIFQGVERKSTPKPVVRPETIEESDSLQDVSAITEPVSSVKNRFLQTSNLESPVNLNPEPLPEVIIEIPDSNSFTFNFYEIPVVVPFVPIDLPEKISINEVDKRKQPDFSKNWARLANTDGFADMIAILKQRASEMGLNDYLTYQLVKSFSKARFPDVDVTSRISLSHFILANMGYDIRIGLVGNIPTLMFPIVQNQIFSSQSCFLNGEKFYIFYEDAKPAAGANEVLSFKVQDYSVMGNKFDLRLKDLNLPYKPHRYSFQLGDTVISGEINKNIFPIIHSYPQMNISDYVESEVSSDVRRQVVKQIKAAVDTMPRIEAINTILSAIQKFDYATDQDYHGFEKPYLFEETLFYDKCDCEDRSIFYGYLLWNVLGAENMLVSYPNHEAVTVRVDEKIPGIYFDYEGSHFYMSDPTCMNAVTGNCANEYRDLIPEIDYLYK